MRPSTVGILLAAGQSTRFGSNKLLHHLKDNIPMVLLSARHLNSVMDTTIAVVDDMSGDVAGLLIKEGMQVIQNSIASQGMGTSIACGVASAPEAPGWVIALSDMPSIPEDIIRAVVTGLEQGADIIAPVYINSQGKNQRGHPVGFSARHAQALMQLDDDRGAQSILLANSDSVELIRTNEQGVIRDIDTSLNCK